MRRPRKSINQINVVPYIDVMLVLLVIFMVTAPLINQGEIELPSVGQALKAPLEPLQISVVAGRKTYDVKDLVTQETTSRLSLDELSALLRARQQQNPARAVVISARADVPYGDVVKLLDQLQQQGVQHVGLMAKQQPN
ncbi:MAG: ExbD/TolR family protein [Proteobacteria bacterium]|nr:ExbD/TolR family protein [Pseudomonadota bacterium]